MAGRTQPNRLPDAIEWLSDNGSRYVAKGHGKFALAIGLEPLTTPIESPQSNGMAEAFVRTFKRDYVWVSPLPDAQTAMGQGNRFKGRASHRLTGPVRGPVGLDVLSATDFSIG